MYKLTIFSLLMITILISVQAKDNNISSGNHLIGFSQEKPSKTTEYCTNFASKADYWEGLYYRYIPLYEQYSKRKRKCENTDKYSDATKSDQGMYIWNKYYNYCKKLKQSKASAELKRLEKYSYTCIGDKASLVGRDNKVIVYRNPDLKVNAELLKEAIPNAPPFIEKYLALKKTKRYTASKCKLIAGKIDLDHQKNTQEWFVETPPWCYENLLTIKQRPKFRYRYSAKATDAENMARYRDSPPKGVFWILQQTAQKKMKTLLFNWGRSVTIRQEKTNGYHNLRNSIETGEFVIDREWYYDGGKYYVKRRAAMDTIDSVQVW